ncbi:hypothetical protein [Rhodoferax mekongensis]|uniref:MSHA biogenesis protein MshK n=1 Tax=Rhodoferax mekongensis TaxID=3068341 RepID=A0ABZ0AZZ0_9BURK|nr:hypothetical protein [Rhodoferax sp. TBRC 17307]WNO05211.1 hypothetical protein RAN89_01970 [Rhodoferax sp. TBRC 17307]
MKRILSCLCLGAAAWAAAADRDPTAPPAEAGVVMPSQAAGGGSAAPQGSSVIMQNGRLYLVVGTRLYAVGQKVGNAKLERITETEIWLREGSQLNKIQRFAGIQRSVAKPAAACTSQPAASSARAKRKASPTQSSDSPQAVTPVAPCEGAQP